MTEHGPRHAPTRSADCIHTAIAAAAARSPHAIAVSDDERQLTYAALMREVRALSIRLAAAGLPPEARVAVVGERSCTLVVALCGVLAAGAAYVPIDPTAAPERMHAMLRDADARAIVTTKACRARVADLGVPIIVVDVNADDHTESAVVTVTADATVKVDVAAVADVAHIAASVAEAMPRPVHGDHLCYVLYTSGTTGEPKGVAVTHASVLNLLRSIQQATTFTAADVWLAVTPVTFDIAGLELWLPLIAGARVVIAPRHTAADGADLRARLRREGVTILQATPSTWVLLLDTGWQAPDGFRVLCGGEPLPPGIARRLIETAGHVWNCYGPTETTIWSTLACLREPDQPITIGRPVARTAVYVLDRSLQPVPPGVLGELYIGGAGLARGYLGRAAQTAAAFRPDPFGRTSGRRIYFTGDIGRAYADGRLECRGRRDRQIKLHGQRIELDAIAAVLDRHPLVRESVTVLRDDESRGAFLAAYVTLREAADREHARAEMRQHLERHLAAYMVPAALAIVAALPRSQHGKIDCAALPPLDAADFRAARESVAPRTPAEALVARTWRDVLGGRPVGAEDEFFDLGGSSLEATRVLQAIRDACGIELSMRVFLEGPTVAALAAEIDRCSSLDEPELRVVVPRVPRQDGSREAVFRLAPQQESWWHSEAATGHVHPANVHFGVRVNGSLNAAALGAAIAALQRRHEALRTSFIGTDANRDADGPAQIIAPADATTLHAARVDLSQLTPDAQSAFLRRLGRMESERACDLAHAPLCRVTHLELNEGEHLVTFTASYLICDAWSVWVLMRDFCTCYSHYATGAVWAAPAVLPPVVPSGLTPLRFQYADYACWQRDWLAGTEAAAQRTYWVRTLTPPWPDVLPPSSEREYAGLAHLSVRRLMPFVFDAQATEAARRLAREERVTLFSVLLAALDVVLHARSGETDLRVGTLAANRDLSGAGDVVGQFANVVCVRSVVDRAAAVRSLMRGVHDAVGEATLHQALPFDQVMRALYAAHPAIAGTNPFNIALLWSVNPAAEPGGRFRMEPDLVEDEDGLVLSRDALDLRFALRETAEVIVGTVTCNTSRLTAAEALAAIDAWRDCLLLAADDSALTVSDLSDALAPRLGACQVSTV